MSPEEIPVVVFPLRIDLKEEIADLKAQIQKLEAEKENIFSQLQKSKEYERELRSVGVKLEIERDAWKDKAIQERAEVIRLNRKNAPAWTNWLEVASRELEEEIKETE
jgi:predicted Holliday junction resolvase-like endonuclease